MPRTIKPLPVPEDFRERLIKDNLVYCEWEDAYGGTADWTEIETIEKGIQTYQCVAVGYLLTNEPSYITVLSHFGRNPPSGWAELTIPRTQIRILSKLNLGRHLQIDWDDQR